jgi:pimeloyl-ACP methyl ester carboxylesterase
MQPRASRRLIAAVAFSIPVALAVGLQRDVVAQTDAKLPIVFVHGFCSDSTTWDAMLLSLQKRSPERFGQPRSGLQPDIARLYFYKGQVKDKDTRSVRSGMSPSNMYAIDFVDDRQSDALDSAFDPHLVSNISIRDKGRELKAVVSRILQESGKPQVLLVGHSMGGLVSRAYIEGLAWDASGQQISFDDDAAGLITIDTPHLGTPAANWEKSWTGFLAERFRICYLGSSENKVELSDSDASLLIKPLNNGAIPDAVNVYSIATKYSYTIPLNPTTYIDGDGVVPYLSQQIDSVAAYAGRSTIGNSDNVIDLGFILNPLSTDQLQIHASIQERDETIATFLPLITRLDGKPGAPSGLTSSAGATTLSLAWNAPSYGGGVTSYVIEAGSRSRARDLANLDMGNAGTVFQARSVSAGTYYIRVRAKNARGLGPSSNEVVVTLGSSCTGAPSAPRSLTGTVSGTTVALSWTAPASGTPTSYVVEAGFASNTSNLVVNDTGGTATSLVASAVGPGTYYVRVKAKNACATSVASNEVVVTVAPIVIVGVQSFAPTGSLSGARGGHTATLLPGGKVLIAGGSDGQTYSASAELYDPATGVFTRTGSMTTERGKHSATLLANGKVLMAGGVNRSGSLKTADLYDPANGTFSQTGNMVDSQFSHTATLLADGRVLLLGGNPDVNIAEIYDPATGRFTATGKMRTNRYWHTATLLPNSKVLVVGGTEIGLVSANTLASAELFDPSAGAFSSAGNLATARLLHTATILPNGRVLLAGGAQNSGYFTSLSSAELYDSATGAFVGTGSMSDARYSATATMLSDGSVLIAGGVVAVGTGGSAVFATAEVYSQAAGGFGRTGSMTTPRDDHTATLLTDGRVLVTGGADGRAFLASAEVYGSRR